MNPTPCARELSPGDACDKQFVMWKFGYAWRRVSLGTSHAAQGFLKP